MVLLYPVNEWYIFDKKQKFVEAGKWARSELGEGLYSVHYVY